MKKREKVRLEMSLHIKSITTLIWKIRDKLRNTKMSLAVHLKREVWIQDKGETEKSKVAIQIKAVFWIIWLHHWI
jgi:hypothetical protein